MTWLEIQIKKPQSHFTSFKKTIVKKQQNYKTKIIFIDKEYLQSIDKEINQEFNSGNIHIAPLALLIRKKYEHFFKRITQLILINENQKNKVSWTKIISSFSSYPQFSKLFDKCEIKSKELYNSIFTFKNPISKTDIKNKMVTSKLLNEIIHIMKAFDETWFTKMRVIQAQRRPLTSAPKDFLMNIEKELMEINYLIEDIIDAWISGCESSTKINKYKNANVFHIEFGCKHFNISNKWSPPKTSLTEINKIKQKHRMCLNCARNLGGNFGVASRENQEILERNQNIKRNTALRNKNR